MTVIGICVICEEDITDDQGDPHTHESGEDVHEDCCMECRPVDDLVAWLEVQVAVWRRQHGGESRTA